MWNGIPFFLRLVYFFFISIITSIFYITLLFIRYYYVYICTCVIWLSAFIAIVVIKFKKFLFRAQHFYVVNCQGSFGSGMRSSSCNKSNKSYSLLFLFYKERKYGSCMNLTTISIFMRQSIYWYYNFLYPLLSIYFFRWMYLKYGMTKI